MAEKRMFSRAVMDEDAFLTLPARAQLTYVHMVLQADDDGFLDRVRSIRRQVGSAPRDVQALVDRGYVIAFASGVYAVAHWHIHNRIRKDTYTPTKHLQERQMLELDRTGVYRLRDGAVTEPSQDRHTGKEREGKDRLGKERKEADDLLHQAKLLQIPESFFPFLTDWFCYKQARQEDQSPATIHSTLVQIKRNLDIHGEAAVAELIRRSIASGWKGIFFDRLTGCAPVPEAYGRAEDLFGGGR